ncbi:hypothetical protein ACIBQX_43320 [Nonomuraea sp. NPDC049714]|uniref:hypothetical protein n=1 Tax=Nonomuraea sp. NPDC049714 TaxID=3364357 RepID=UPI00379E2159
MLPRQDQPIARHRTVIKGAHPGLRATGVNFASGTRLRVWTSGLNLLTALCAYRRRKG